MAVPTGNSVPLTGNPLIDGLTEGSSWRLGADRTLTYSLDDDPDFGSWSGLTGLSADIRAAFDAWSNVANIHFLQVAGTGDPATSPADIAFILTRNTLAHAAAIA